MNKYPRVTSVQNRNKNTSAKCKCGRLGKFKSVVEWDYFRGNDDVYWSCETHKKDVKFLTGTINKQEF